MRVTPDSSSSDQTADVNWPSDVLALGRRIARELRADGERDTLREWLAHHLAELIEQAGESEAARDHAVETILKIWAQRRDLPGRAYPLADYNEVLAVLGRIGPNANPWRELQKGERGYELAAMFDSFTRLIWAGMILTLPQHILDADEAIATSMLDDEEHRIYDAFHGWSAYFDQKRRRQPSTRVRIVPETQLAAERREAETAEGPPRMQIRKVLEEIVSGAQASLSAFHAGLDDLLVEHEFKVGEDGNDRGGRVD